MKPTIGRAPSPAMMKDTMARRVCSIAASAASGVISPGGGTGTEPVTASMLETIHSAQAWRRPSLLPK